MSIRRLLSYGLIFAGLALIFISTWPLPLDTISWQSNTVTANGIDTQFTLSWPAVIRAGEPRTARFSVQTPSGAATKAVLIARLEFPGIIVQPSGEIAQPISANGANEFTWSLEPLTQGIHSGTIWLYQSEAFSVPAHLRMAVVSRPIEIHAIHLGPLPIVWLRWLGVILMAIGVVLLTRR